MIRIQVNCSGIKNAGIKGLDSVINAVIIISAWSSGNSFLYISSRSLYSMAVAGNAPAVFKKCTKNGVPYMAVFASAIFTPLAYLNCASSGSTVFTWFVNLTNTSGFISCKLPFYLGTRCVYLPLSSNEGVVQDYFHWGILIGARDLLLYCIPSIPKSLHSPGLDRPPISQLDATLRGMDCTCHVCYTGTD